MIDFEMADASHDNHLRRELVHRFRNSAQMMSSIFNLQRLNIDKLSAQEIDLKKELLDINRRLMTIAQIHQGLEWVNGSSKLNLSQFIRHAVAQVEIFSDQSIICELEGREDLLDFDLGLSSGIVFSEALSCFVALDKRATASRPPIHIYLYSTDRLRLEISAKGRKAPRELINASKHCFGLWLAESQVQYADIDFDIELPNKPSDALLFRLNIPMDQTHDVYEQFPRKR